MARQNCSLACSRIKFILSLRNLFGPRRLLAGGVRASSNRRRKREEQDEASGLLNLQVKLLCLFCSSHFVILRKLIQSGAEPTDTFEMVIDNIWK